MEGIGDGRKDERDVKGKGRMGIIVQITEKNDDDDGNGDDTKSGKDKLRVVMTRLV